MALSTSAVVTLFRFRHPPSALLKSLAYRHFATTSSSDDNNWASTSSSSQWSDRSAARSGGDLTIRYERGLPIVSVPLPSRKEICQFTVRPVSDTVGDLCRNISAEDRGIDLVAMYSSDGVRISYSTRVEHVLQLGAFQLRINDTMYTAAPPTPLPLVDAESAAAVDAAHVSTEHLQTIADVKSTIGALYAALHVDEHKLKIERDLLVKLEQLRTQVRPLEEMKALIDAECERRTDRLLWLGMAAMGAQMGVYARLTWWEYSWDIMEPVTYFTTYATVIGSFGYYLLTRQTYDYPSAKERTHLSYFHRRAVKHGFDLAKYNRLKESIAEVERDLARLRDPLYQHLPATRLASLIAQSAVNHTVASSNTSSYSPPTSPRSSSSPS